MNRLRHITQLIAALLTVLLVASCQKEISLEPWTDTEDESQTFLTFDITLPAISDTRTPSSGEYDNGTAEWENYINIHNDLHFYIFDGNENGANAQFLASLNPLATVIEQDETDNRGSNYKRYKVRSIVQQKLTPPFRLVALANCGEGNYPTVDANGNLKLGSTNITNLSQLATSLTYTMSEPIAKLDANNLIPMFGVSKITELAKIGDDTNIGRIDLLRAWAKVDVMSADETNDLASVTLHNYNTCGLVCPTSVYERSHYVHDDWDNDYVGHISLPSSPGIQLSEHPFSIHHTTTLTRGDNTTVSRNVYTLYIPEYRNLIEGTTTLQENYSYITLGFEGADTRSFRLDFRHYPEGAYFDIERNNYYKYTVRRNDFDVEIAVDVVPYIGVNLEPDFGFDDFRPIPTS